MQQESLWKQASKLAHEMFIRQLRTPLMIDIPMQGEKIEIPQIQGARIAYIVIDEVVGEGESAIGGEGVIPGQ